MKVDFFLKYFVRIVNRKISQSISILSINVPSQFGALGQ